MADQNNDDQSNDGTEFFKAHLRSSWDEDGDRNGVDSGNGEGQNYNSNGNTSGAGDNDDYGDNGGKRSRHKQNLSIQYTDICISGDGGYNDHNDNGGGNNNLHYETTPDGDIRVLLKKGDGSDEGGGNRSHKQNLSVQFTDITISDYSKDEPQDGRQNEVEHQTTQNDFEPPKPPSSQRSRQERGEEREARRYFGDRGGETNYDVRHPRNPSPTTSDGEILAPVPIKATPNTNLNTIGTLNSIHGVGTMNNINPSVSRKHRRVFSGRSNPALAHRRMNSRGDGQAMKGHRRDISESVDVIDELKVTPVSGGSGDFGRTVDIDSNGSLEYGKDYSAYGNNGSGAPQVSSYAAHAAHLAHPPRFEPTLPNLSPSRTPTPPYTSSNSPHSNRASPYHSYSSPHPSPQHSGSGNMLAPSAVPVAPLPPMAPNAPTPPSSFAVNSTVPPFHTSHPPLPSQPPVPSQHSYPGQHQQYSYNYNTYQGSSSQAYPNYYGGQQQLSMPQLPHSHPSNQSSSMSSHYYNPTPPPPPPMSSGSPYYSSPYMQSSPTHQPSPVNSYSHMQAYSPSTQATPVMSNVDSTNLGQVSYPPVYPPHQQAQHTHGGPLSHESPERSHSPLSPQSPQTQNSYSNDRENFLRNVNKDHRRDRFDSRDFQNSSSSNRDPNQGRGHHHRKTSSLGSFLASTDIFMQDDFEYQDFEGVGGGGTNDDYEVDGYDSAPDQELSGHNHRKTLSNVSFLRSLSDDNFAAFVENEEIGDDGEQQQQHEEGGHSQFESYLKEQSSSPPEGYDNPLARGNSNTSAHSAASTDTSPIANTTHLDAKIESNNTDNRTEDTSNPPPPPNDDGDFTLCQEATTANLISPPAGRGINSNTGTKETHKRIRKKCMVEECQNRVVQGGLCITHGAKRKTCNYPGCTKNVKKAGMCSTHGPARRRCGVEGCEKVAVQGGRCIAHGAKKKGCAVEGCEKQAIMGGKCKKHYDEEHGIVKVRKTKAKATPKEKDKSTNKGEKSDANTCEELGGFSDLPPIPLSREDSGHKRGLSFFQDIDTMDAIINSGLNLPNANASGTSSERSSESPLADKDDGLRGLSISSGGK